MHLSLNGNTTHPHPPPPTPQGAAAMSIDVWRRICRRLHNPTSNKEKKEVLGPYRLAVAKISAAVPLQVGGARRWCCCRGGGQGKECAGF
jgi:hypothetical protein